MLRRTHRFILVARRLELQIEEMTNAGEDGAKEGEGKKERAMNKAALSIAEIGSSFVFFSCRVCSLDISLE